MKKPCEQIETVFEDTRHLRLLPERRRRSVRFHCEFREDGTDTTSVPVRVDATIRDTALLQTFVPRLRVDWRGRGG
jgi:hypothetical protein